MTLVPPAAMPPELRALWRLTDGDEGDDATYDVPGDLLGEDGAPDLDAANERVDDLADEFARERGYREAFVGKEGAWLVTLPLEFVRQQPGYEDVESLDELADADRQYWEERHWDEASLRIADAQLLGMDPTVPHPGIDEREAAVEAARTDVERREKTVEAREAALERVVARKRSEVERIDAEIEAKRAEAVRLDAELEAKSGEYGRAVAIIEGADEYTESVRSRAERDAEATRAGAEADAKRTRAEARELAQEGVSEAVGDAEEKVTRLVAEFTSRVVGNVCQLAYGVLKAMRDNMRLGDEFDRAATTCMATLHQVVEQDRDGLLVNFIEGKARGVLSDAFSKRARREVLGPVFREDWEPRPSGRSRDDGPGL